MNNLTGLSVSGLSYLTYLDCSDNLISGIDFTNSYNITGLYLQNNDLSGNLDLTQFEDLKEVNVSGNNLTGINITGLNKLETFIASNNLITGVVNFLGTTGVKNVLIQNNLITGVVNFNDLTQIGYFNLSGNNISDLTPIVLWATGQYGLMAVASGLFVF
jgi:Leucine-rich repeat (LRR) protein